MPDSSTGGIMAPEASPAVTADKSLTAVLQPVLAGITGLSGDLVRRSWQIDPPPSPAATVDWLAFGVVRTVGDSDPYFEQVAAPVEADPEADPPVEADPDRTVAEMRRHEELDVLCTFYGPNGQGLAARLRDGLNLAQNRDDLEAEGITVVSAEEPVHAPELENQRWVERWDVTLTLRREIVRRYPVLHLVRAQGQMTGNRVTESVTGEFDTGATEP